MSDKPQFILESYDPNKTYKEQKKFDCGNEVINKFVRSSLKKQVKDKISGCVALLDQDAEDRFVGFYTLTMFSINASMLSSLSQGSLPSNVPCTRMVMLGVRDDYQGQQLGSKLLQNAITRAVSASADIGSLGLYLDADPPAVDFYLDHGFVALKTISKTVPTPMFLHNKTAINAMQHASLNINEE